MNTQPLKLAFDRWLRGQPRNTFPGCCYPRTILPPNGYLSPKLYAVSMVGLMYSAQTEADKQRIGETLSSEAFESISKHDPASLLLAAKLAELQVPTYFVAEEFLCAVAATEPPKEGTLKGLHWPMEAMLFVLPLDFMRSYLGRDVGFLAMSRQASGDCTVGKVTVRTVNERVLFHFPMVCKNGVPIDYRGAYGTDRSLADIEKAPFMHDPAEKKVEQELGADLITEEEEQSMNMKMNALGIKLLLAMNARPDLVEHQQVATPGKPARQSREEVRPTYHPNVLGKGYRIVREGLPDGTHASPRMHWRRGHMRRQRHGHGRSLTKIVWIEPSLVMSDKEKDEQK